MQSVDTSKRNNHPADARTIRTGQAFQRPLRRRLPGVLVGMLAIMALACGLSASESPVVFDAQALAAQTLTALALPPGEATDSPTAVPSATANFTPTAGFTPTALFTLPPLPTATLAPSLTPLPTLSQFALSGVTFFDYNGNGIQDGVEPPLAGVVVQAGEQQGISGQDGVYRIEGLEAGLIEVNLQASDYSFIALSTKQFFRIDEAIAIEVNGHSRQDFGLMQGFLTLPFASEHAVDRMYDYAKGGGLLWWDGTRTCLPDDAYCGWEVGGTDNHFGIDYGMDIGEEVLAAAAGTIRFANIAGCNLILVDHHLTIGGRPMFTMYAHLSKPLVDTWQTVERGQLIGLSGDICGPYPHLHFDLRSRPVDNEQWAFFDPFKPLVDVPNGFWRDKKQNPYPHWTDSEYHPAVDRNWWTVENSPQYPAVP